MRSGPLILAATTALALMLPASANHADGLKIKITEWTLPNGMKVLYSPMRKVPVVTVQVWYHAGSKDERVGIRGIAHMFEHMMFKGSKRVAPEDHARHLSGIGGSVNAFTTDDVTAYHNTLPKQYMEFAMKLEAERMRALHLTDSTIASEREVVKEEKRSRMENSPIGRALEAIHDMAFTKHPYAWTPAGTIEDLNKIDRAACQKFYDTYYVPNNATLIVVGDVDEATVRAAAQKQFGAITAGKLPPRPTATEPPQTALRQRDADWPSQLTVVLGAYHIPGANGDDIPALKVLSAILSAGQSSRLNQALVRKGKLALAAGGFVREMEHPGLLYIYAVGLPTHDLDRMKAALLTEVERVASGGVTKKELTRALNQISTRRLSSLGTVSGLASALGMSTYLRGDPRAFLKDVARLDKVTVADIKRVAGSYLQRKNLSLILLGRAKKSGGQGKQKGGAK